MPIVEQDQVLARVEDGGRVQADGFVQLQRIRRPPEIAVGQQQLVDRGEQLDRALQVQEIAPAPRHVGQLQRRAHDHRQVRRRHVLQAATGFAQVLVEADDEVVQVEVVDQEQVLAHVLDPERRERIGRGVGAGVAGDEREHLRTEMEMPQDQPVRLGPDEVLHAPGQQPVQLAREGPAAWGEGLDHLEQHDQGARERTHEGQHELARARAGICEPGALDLLVQRRAPVEVERKPGTGIARVVGLFEEVGRVFHDADSTRACCNGSAAVVAVMPAQAGTQRL